MKDIDVFQKMLGQTDPWELCGVEYDWEKETILMELRVKPGTVWGCPVCSKRMHVHGMERRKWRHMDTQSYRTWIEAEVPTVKCEEHGSQQVLVPWAEPYSRNTMAFEHLVIVLLQGMTTKEACKHLGMTWDEADGIKQRAVKRGLARRALPVMKILCVDEKHVGKNGYLTLVWCLDSGKAKIVYVGQGKGQDALDAFWETLTPEQLVGIEVINMDMSEAYTQSVLKCVPGGQDKIVYDRFHIAQHMGKAVDEVRRQEHARLTGAEEKAMKGSRYWWLYSPDHVPRNVKRQFRDLQQIARKTAKAWEFKELLREFWRCPDVEEGRCHIKAWLSRALRSSLAPVRKVAKMCKARLKNLLTYFEHRTTNASAEAMNSRIQSLINQACGYRNPLRLIAEIFFRFGGLDMMPRFAQ